MRLIKQEKTLLFISSGFYPIYGLITSPLFCFTFNLGVKGLILSFSSAKFFTVLFMFWKLYSSDWSKAEDLSAKSENMIQLIDVEEFDKEN